MEIPYSLSSQLTNTVDNLILLQLLLFYGNVTNTNKHSIHRYQSVCVKEI